jgi:hypothetical protein
MTKTASNQHTDEPSAREIASAVEIFSRLKPGFLPFPVFLETCRLTVSTIVEVVPLRKKDGRVQVLLTKRSDDDLFWPGMFHTPGTLVRATDEEGSYKSAFARILGDELAAVALAGEPEYVYSTLHKLARGMENANIFFVEVSGEPTVGVFYDMDSLPDNVIQEQLDFIHKAAEKFAATSR